MRATDVGVWWTLVRFFARTDARIEVDSHNDARRLEEVDEVCREGHSCGGEYYRMGVYCYHLVGSEDFDILVRSLSGTVPLCSKCAQSACRQDQEVYDATLTKARQCDDVTQAVAGSEAEMRAFLFSLQCGVLETRTDFIRLIHGPLVARARTKATILGLPTLFESTGRHRLLTIEANTSMRLEMVTLTGGYDEAIGGGCVAVGAGSVLTLFRSVLVNCTSLYSGGAIQAFENSEISLIESIVAESHSLGSGGGIRIHVNSRLALQDGSIIANSSAFTGGGVQSARSTIVLNTSSRISHCNVIGAAPFSGGGIFVGELSTLIIDGGAEITDSMGNRGGCIYAFWRSNIRLRAGAALRRCVASSEGGGVAAFLGLDLDCENALFEDNHAASVGGGAIYANDELTVVSLASTVIRRCTKNLVSSTTHVGAAVATETDVVVVQSLVEDSFGAGTAVTGRSILLLDSRITRFHGGSCIGLSDVGVARIVGSHLLECVGGGGVQSSQNSVIYVTNSTIANCVSFGDGGGISLAVGAVGVFENTIFSENTAPTGVGGAIFADNVADVQIRASRFERNSAVNGGAVSISPGATLSVSGMCAFLIISVDDIVARPSLFFYLKPRDVSSPEYVDARGQSTWKRLVDSVNNDHEFCLAFGTSYELFAADLNGLGWEGISWQAKLSSGEVRALDIPQPGEHAIKVYDIAPEDAVAKPCDFVGNFAADSGGAIYLNSSAALRVGPETVFSQNVAAGSAGAIDAGPRCATNIRRSVLFERNEALGGDGGAVRHGIFTSTVIVDSIARGNRASGHGGFAFFDVSDFVGLDEIFATANVGGSDGGAIFFRDCRYGVNHVAKSTFFNNTSLRGTGGGCAAVSSRVDFYGVAFRANIAVNGGGVGVGQRSETKFFEGAYTPKVKVVVDWTNTTQKCIRDAPGPPWTCDRTTRECDLVDNFMDCRGCVCYVETENGAENYFELASSTDTRYGQPAANAVIVYEYDDLTEGDWTLSARASRYSSWFGGSVNVFVDSDADGDIIIPDALTSTTGIPVVVERVAESSTVNVRVPAAVSRKCEFIGNIAHRGGGACYWETDAAPAGLSGITAAVNFEANSASYGESVATPAKSLVTVDAITAPSGELAPRPLQVTLNDAYQQRVVLEEKEFVTAIATVVFPPGASTRSNIAAFSESGIATFNDLVITYKPESTVNLSIFSPLSTLKESDVVAVVALRGCLPGEIEVDDKCQECRPRMYWSPADKLCHQCTHGMACRDSVNIPLAPDRLLPSLKLKKGYMRQSKVSKRAVQCHGSSHNPHCPGGNHVGCVKYAIGPTCQVCRLRYYRDASQCRSCGSMPSISYLIKISLWGIIVLVLVSYITRATIRTRYSRVNSTVRPWLKLMRKWRLIFVALQILASVPSSFPTFVLPPVYSKFFYVLSLMNAIFLPANCMPIHMNSRATFYDQLLGMIVGPVVMCLILTLARTLFDNNRGGMGRPESPHEESGPPSREWQVMSSQASEASPSSRLPRTMPRQRTPAAAASVILITFILYPMMSNTVVSTFWCVKYDSPREVNSAVWYLQADLSLRCAGRTYAAWRTVAACALCTHVVGVPVFYFLCLYTMRHRLHPEIDGKKPRLTRRCAPDVIAAVELANEKRNRDPSISHLALLYTLYRPQFWYWEVLESIRRFLMSSAIGLLSSGGDVSKVLYALILSLFSIRLYSQFEPFAEESDNVLAEGLAVMLTVTFFSMLIVAINADVKHLGVILMSIVLLSFAILLCLVYRDMNREISAISKIRTCVVEASRKLSENIVLDALDDAST